MADQQGFDPDEPRDACIRSRDAIADDGRLRLLAQRRLALAGPVQLGRLSLDVDLFHVAEVEGLVGELDLEAEKLLDEVGEGGPVAWGVCPALLHDLVEFVAAVWRLLGMCALLHGTLGLLVGHGAVGDVTVGDHLPEQNAKGPNV